jgi:CheY-like chemotaxis protein
VNAGPGHEAGQAGKEKASRGRVLVVDDEMHLRLYIKAVFETAGFETATARDGEEGFRKAVEWKPDLVSLDLMMPGEGGIRLFQKLKAHPELHGAKVLVVSAIADQTFRHSLALLRAGTPEGDGGPPPLPEPDGYVEKPPRPDALLAEAERILQPTANAAHARERTKEA